MLWRRVSLTCTVFLSIILWACSSQKRAVKHVNKAITLAGPDFVCNYVNGIYCRRPYIDSILTIDSTVVSREIIKYDTVWILNKDTTKIETLYYNSEKLQIRIIRQIDTIKVKAECKSDTVYREKIIYVTKTVSDHKPDSRNSYIKSRYVKLFGIILVIILLLFILWRGISRFLKTIL